MNLSSIKYRFPFFEEQDDPIAPVNGYGPGCIDQGDIKQMGEKILDNMIEEGDVDLGGYARDFIERANESDNYQRIAQELLEERGKSIDFQAEFAIMLNECLEQRLDYLESDMYNVRRIDRFSLDGYFDYPEEDMREVYEDAMKSQETAQEHQFTKAEKARL